MPTNLLSQTPPHKFAGSYAACEKCAKIKVGDYPECHLVENDYPELQEIGAEDGDMSWKLILEGAFQFVQKMRCEFMGFLIMKKEVTPNEDGTYTLPEYISMRPIEMMELEAEMIALAKIPPSQATAAAKIKFHNVVDAYRERAKAFFEGQCALIVPTQEREIITL